MPYSHALITGATSGIGEAFADALPPETKLLLTGRDPERLQALQSRLSAEGRSVEAVRADLADASDRARLAEMAEEFGIDLFVNNAGLGVYGKFTDNDYAQLREMVEVNCVAVTELARALMPGMIRRAEDAEHRRAAMIVVGSIVSFAPMPYMAAYAATKMYDLCLAQALAEECANDPIDILALCPGTTRTRFFARAGMNTGWARQAEDADAVARKTLKRLGRKRVFVSPWLLRPVLEPLTWPTRLITFIAKKVLEKK